MYTEWTNLLKGRQSKSLGAHIALNQRPNVIAVTFYDTDVLSLSQEDILTLFTNNYRTVSTRSVMNDYLPEGIAVHVKNRQWSVTIGDKSVLFSEGMQIQIDPEGTDHQVIGDMSSDTPNPLVQMIEKYLKGLTPEVVKEALADMGDDCWYCIHELESHLPPEKRSIPIFSGKEVGGQLVTSELPVKSEHLKDHIEEGVYNGSMLIQAFRAAGHRDAHFAVGSLSISYTRRQMRKWLYKRLLENAGA